MKLFEYGIKSYLKIEFGVECLETFFNTGQLHIRGTKTLFPSFYCFYNTLNTSLLAWPFSMLVVFFQENVFQQVAAHFCLE
jgi:hypothetical protein